MIIVDDCSTDHTVDIIEAIAKEDPRIKLIKQPVNGGAAKARNISLNEMCIRDRVYCLRPELSANADKHKLRLRKASPYLATDLQSVCLFHKYV